GIPHEMVGHYLVEDVPHEYIASDPPGSGQLALLPGSRTQEIERMLAPMLAAARTYLDRFGGRAVVAGIDGAHGYDTVLRQAGEEISVSFEDSRRLLYESDLVLTASGTATLEAGIIARPMVVIYKTGFITYQIARRLVTLPMIALVNLVIGEKIVPELIQHEASPERMAAELAWYKEDDTYRENVLAALKRVAGILGGRGASERAAKVVEGYL
ncbi:hypothetical protein GF420_11515, partial [candidate division GN15 bacterium]|nr:hypothetical protein [candidate division GN15 bacterium]